MEISGSEGGPRGGWLWTRLLRLSLFYKILIANGAIVLASTVAATALTRAALRSGAPVPVFLLATVGVLVTILVNAWILRLALRPLELLEETAAEVHHGNLDARVPFSPLRDPQMDRLTRTFNSMLDGLEGYRQRLSGVAARALRAEEQERKRIARELHDDTAQSLAALLIGLRIARSAEDPAVRDEALDHFRGEVGEALERIRRFARGLRPPALEELGVVAALEAHTRALAESVEIPIRVESEPIEGLLSPDAELAFYRIAQEAISNAIRHANPARVSVRIAREPTAVTLTVTDDGSGFDLREVTAREDGGLGLFGMNERAAYFGGQVTIDSRIGAGTTVRATIPTADRMHRLA